LKKEQRPARQTFEQQVLLPLQASPRVEQLPAGFWHVPEQTLPQHWLFELQALPAVLQVEEVEQWPVLSQSSEQHCAAMVHAAPTERHWFGPLHRFVPSTSTSQCLEQQSASAAQTWPVGLHDEAGTSHLPFTQLSEQQSVFLAQLPWKGRQVAQLTPTKHCTPKQQPFGHEVLLHTQAPFWHRPPLGQAGPLPHEQAPLVQLSASFGSQAMQAMPPAPQLVAVGGFWQVEPTQQPLQVCEQPAQLLPMHWSPLAHAEHVEPPAPHAFGWLPGRQTLF
jgi:hypothetical protein